MHSDEERSALCKVMFDTARKIALHAPSCKAGKDGWEYLQFCVRHGYYCFPTDTPGNILAGTYLQPGRAGYPTTLEEIKGSLGIIVCFSDEIMPCNPLRKTTADGAKIICSGYVSQSNRLLGIGDIDLYTPVDLALTLLHEVRHARQYFGNEFENLPPLDPEEFHESRTWKSVLDLLDACGGKIWQQAVSLESGLLINSYARRQRCPGDNYFAWSGERYPKLDQIFGAPKTERSGSNRSLLVAMRANFLLAENAQLPNIDQAYANIVGAYYTWCKKE